MTINKIHCKLKQFDETTVKHYDLAGNVVACFNVLRMSLEGRNGWSHQP